MQRLRNYVIASVIALLVVASTASSQTQPDPPKPSPPRTPPTKFVKHKPSVPNRYIVVLNDDAVRDDQRLEVRRARVTAIANKHAQAYGGKFDYIYETVLKGYAIELPNEAAAIAISNLPEVKFVEEVSLGFAIGPRPPTAQPTESLCRGKPISVSLLDVGGPKLSGPRHMALLYGGISQPSRLVIRNRDEFNELWKQLIGPGSNKPPPPEVDFSREMIVVAAMGQKPSPSYAILIDGACEVDNQLEVFVRSVDYTKCGLQLGVITAPADIVRIPRTELPVVFRETEVTSDCKEILRP